MLETHHTREGDSCLIAQMTDEHLSAMIRLVLGGMNEVRDFAQTSDLDPYQRALYGLPKVDLEEAAHVNRKAIQKLYPYLAEAFLRGMDDLRDELREIIGRSEAVAGGLPRLPHPNLAKSRRDNFEDMEIPF